MFVDTLNNNYQLLQGSPCIDAGNPDTTGLNLPPSDLAGQPRIYNGRIDIGAYEWQGQGIYEPDTSFINKLYLFQNKPNPFSSSTKITFISADYERIKDYKLSIYNAKGQLIKTYNGRKHNFWVKTDIVWDGTDEDGKQVPSGVYFYKLEYDQNAVTKKMILMR
ncbi:MAG: T9SS type A sorting domain-containing protein [Candidatus Cloacimonetes bacterium]|nr:T9SS type A sorting domain-containing protein [Candidatus Cloacimonadota bacterium]